MTPSDNYANHSGSWCHSKANDKPEQLHKEPDTASPCCLDSASVAAAAATTTTTSGDNNNGGRVYGKEKNNLEVDGRMEERLFNADCKSGIGDTSELTSLFAHLDEVKRQSDLLINSAPATKTVVTLITGISNNSNNNNSSCRETNDAKRQVDVSESSNLETMRDLSYIGKPLGQYAKSESLLVERKLSPQIDESRMDWLRSPTSSHGSDLRRCNSDASFSNLSELISENFLNDHLLASGASGREHLRGKQTSNTIFILQHLMQKRNELRSIDKQLIEIMSDYLVQLDLLQPDQSKRSTSSQMPDNIHEESSLIRLAWQQQQQRQTYPSNNNDSSNLSTSQTSTTPLIHSIETKETTNNNDRAIDLSLEGKRCLRGGKSISGGQSILLPASSSFDCQDSRYKTNCNDSTYRNDNTGMNVSKADTNYNRQQEQKHQPISSSDIDQQYNSSASTNNNTSQTTTTPRKSITVNLKKSRLLGANFYQPQLDTTSGQTPITKTISSTITPQAPTTNTQQCSNYNNADGDVPLSSSMGLAQTTTTTTSTTTTTYHRASPLNLLKRYRTPSPSPSQQLQPTTIITNTNATMAISPQTASTSSPASSGVLKLELQQQQQQQQVVDANQQSLEFHHHHHHHQRRRVILSPVAAPAVAAIARSSLPAASHIEGPETPHSAPSPIKRFRSVSQMVDTTSRDDTDQQQQQQQQLLADGRYEPLLSRQYEKDSTMTTLFSLNSSETLNPGYGSLRTAFDYSNHHHQHNPTLSMIAAQTDYDANLGGTIHNYSTNFKQLAPIVGRSNDQYNLVSSGSHMTNSDGQHPCQMAPLLPPPPPPPTTMMMLPVGSHLNHDLNYPNNNSMGATPRLASSRETLELMHFDRDYQHHHHHHQHDLLPAPQQFAPAHLLQQRELQKIAYRCHVCGSSFEDRHRLQQHLSIHLNLHPSWFEEKTIKETMARYESKRGDYLCNGCNQRFETTAEFDRHMHLHGDKPHHCELCNQDNKLVSFRYYRQLLTHLRSHCFLYSCRFVPDCKQTANRKDYLKLHILKHHLNNKLPEQFTVCCH